jgi:Spy/CpxP family protein refolding chaperone
MKTKHYLIVSGAVVIGIIIGVVFSTTIIRKQQEHRFYDRMGFNMEHNDFGMRSGSPFANFNHQRMPRMQKNRPMQGMRGGDYEQDRMMRYLDLSEEQQEQIKTIRGKNRMDREEIFENRQGKRNTMMDEIDSILTDEQKEQLEECRGRQGRRNFRGHPMRRF